MAITVFSGFTASTRGGGGQIAFDLEVTARMSLIQAMRSIT